MVNLNMIEELKSRFPDVKNVAPYGSCLVVPGAEFDPDWEAQLADQGFMCHEAVLDRKPVTLVKLAKNGGDGEKVVYEPPAKRGQGIKVTKSFTQWTEKEDERLLLLWPKTPGSVLEKCEKLTIEFPGRTAKAIALYYPKAVRKQKKGEKSHESPRAEQSRESVGPELSETSSRKDWTGEDDKLLAEKWKEGNLSVREIFKQYFPSRSKGSVAMRVFGLQKKGLIQKKQLKGGRPKGKKQPEKNASSVHTSVRTSDAAATASTLARNESKSPSTSTEDPVCGLLKEILQCLRTQFEPAGFSFEHHCRKCGTSGIADSEEVWRVCPRCGEPLIIWNVQSLEVSE